MNCQGCQYAGVKIVCGQCRTTRIAPNVSRNGKDMPEFSTNASGNDKSPVSPRQSQKTASGESIKLINKKMTKVEATYGFMLNAEFPESVIKYEAIKLKMSNGHVYTPDWCVIMPDKNVLLVEVKDRSRNGFRQASYGRARLAYHQCQKEFKCFTFRWAERYKGQWIVE